MAQDSPRDGCYVSDYPTPVTVTLSCDAAGVPRITVHTDADVDAALLWLFAYLTRLTVLWRLSRSDARLKAFAQTTVVQAPDAPCR